MLAQDVWRIGFIYLLTVTQQIHVIGVGGINAGDFPHRLKIGPNQQTVGSVEDGQYRYLMYSGLATYDQDTSILFPTDDDPYGLAWQAWIEMQDAYTILQEVCQPNGGLDQRMPSVMAAMAIGSEVYFASSMRGTLGEQLLYVEMANSDITTELNRWASVQQRRNCGGTAQEHRTAVCGEIWATAMYISKNGIAPRAVTGADPHGPPASVHNARVAAWGSFRTDDIKKQGHAVKPCNQGPDTPNDQWGCKSFMAYQGLREMTTGVYFNEKDREDPPMSHIEPGNTQPFGVPIQRLAPATDPNAMDTN